MELNSGFTSSKRKKILLVHLLLLLLLLLSCSAAAESPIRIQSVLGGSIRTIGIQNSPSRDPQQQNSPSNQLLPISTIGSNWRKKAELPLQVSVTHFGAVGDGSTDDTEAFVEAWNRSCSSLSGAVLHVPPRHVFLVRPIDLVGPCNKTVTMMISGIITAPSDPDAWNGLDPHRWLYFHRVRNLELAGGGTIDGMGQKWWAKSCKINATNPCRKAPTAVTFHQIKNLNVHDLTLKNSQQTHMVFSRCSRVAASHLKVIAPAESPNTDGIHISSSNSVFVQDSTISTGDDCISVVGNSSNVYITEIVCGPGHGISIGSLGQSNSMDQVKDVHVDGAFILNAENGARIKTWQGGQGYAMNINFHNIIVKNVSYPIIIDQYYCDSKSPCQNQTSAIKVEEISFVGIKGTSAKEDAMKFACSDTYPCVNIYLEDIQLSLDSGEDPKAYCWKASGSSSGLVYPPSCLSSTDGVIKQKIIADTVFRSREK